MKLPSRYSYLLSVRGGLPKMVAEAVRWYGTKEIPGKPSNPVIMAWARAVGAASYYLNDDTPWCALFMAYVATVAGKKLPFDPLAAKNWARFGRGIEEKDLALGDIIVFPHHVCIYVGESRNGAQWFVLGGNQQDQVCIVPWKKGGAIAYRRPEYSIGQPESVQKYYLDAQGLVDVKIV
jgi:uncharacterized protein (TIGR02594 family)